jgi:hypothetical protein
VIERRDEDLFFKAMGFDDLEGLLLKVRVVDHAALQLDIGYKPKIPLFYN